VTPATIACRFWDIFELPDTLDEILIVMPFLRPFDQPRFQTYGEFVAFLTQICEVSSTCHLVLRDIADLTSLDTLGHPGSPIHARAKHCTSVRMNASVLEFRNHYQGSLFQQLYFKQYHARSV